MLGFAFSQNYKPVFAFMGVENIRKFYIEALKLEPLLLIDALIKQIKLYNDKVEITFNTPTLQSPNDKGFFNA